MEIKKGTIKTALAITAGVSAVSALTSYIITHLMIELAVSREVPKIFHSSGNLFSGSSATNEEIDAVMSASKRLAEIETEDVNITSADGTPLVGHFYRHPTPKRIIVAMHGWRSSWHRDFGMMFEHLKENGCSILFPEQRGQNASGGEHIGFGLKERHDCLEWINFVTKNYGTSLPVYLYGISMGASTVLMTAGAELPDCVRGIIADCGFTSPRDIWKHVINKNLHMSYGLRGILADGMFEKKLKIKTTDYSTLEAMKTCKTPILFIHGARDSFVPIKMTYKNYLACLSEKRLLVSPEAGHAMSYFYDKKEYDRALCSFWCDFDSMNLQING